MQEGIPLNVRIIIDACRKAERQIVKDFVGGGNIEVFDKGNGKGMCTSTDVAVESILKAELLRSKPGCGFICEESGISSAHESDFVYIIDPIDGTTNFIHKLPFFSISVALAKVDKFGTYEVIAGVIYAPVLRQIYWAVKGQKAYMETDNMYISRIRCRRKKTFDNSVISFTSSCFRNINQFTFFLEKCCNKGSSTRIFGSASLCMANVASGRLDVFFGSDLKPWDVAAGLLIVHESGGIVMDYSGKSASINSSNIACCSSELEPKCLALFNS